MLRMGLWRRFGEFFLVVVFALEMELSWRMIG